MSSLLGAFDFQLICIQFSRSLYYKRTNSSVFVSSRPPWCIIWYSVWFIMLLVRDYQSWSLLVYASVTSTCAQPPPPRATAGHLPALSVPGVGHLQILHCPGAGHLPTPGHSRAFDTHAVSYQNITTQKVLLEQKQIGSSVKDRNKL